MSEIDEFYDNYVKELDRLVELLNIYDSLEKDSADFTTKKFYLYSIKLTINRINELLSGDEELRKKFKQKFEKEVSSLFDSTDIDNPFGKFENE